MAKKKNNVYYIAAAVIVVIVIAVLLMRKPAEMPEEPEVVEPEVVVEEEEVVLPEPEVATEYAGDEIIANAVCIGREIQAVITNTGTETVEIGRGLTIQINGNAVVKPDCEKTTVAAGESIQCDNLAGPLVGLVKPGKQNEVVVKLKAASAQATVTCE